MVGSDWDGGGVPTVVGIGGGVVADGGVVDGGFGWCKMFG